MVTVLCYSVMNMKYFRYIGIIYEYVKNRAEKCDSVTIMKMKWRELPVPLAVDETVCRSRHFVRDRHIWNNCFCNLTLTKWEFVIDTFSHNFSCCSCGFQLCSARRLLLWMCCWHPRYCNGVFLLCWLQIPFAVCFMSIWAMSIFCSLFPLTCHSMMFFFACCSWRGLSFGTRWEELVALNACK